MAQYISHISLIVADYDQAITFYTQILGFELVEDTRLSDDKRWVLVKPKGQAGCSLLLARAATPEQMKAVGNQSGGRVFLFLYTDDFWRDYNMLLGKGVQFVRPPQEFDYGIVAVFADLYGNLWDLFQPA